MILRAKLRMEQLPEPVDCSLAYPLYAWLLSHISSEAGNRLHEQGVRPIHQYLSYNPKTKECWWMVYLLNDETVGLFAPILENTMEARLHSGVIGFASCELEQIDTPYTFIQRAASLSLDRRFPLEFLTPTSFKQSGRYVIFPQESLILQSLIAHLGMCFPEMPLDDADVFVAMQQGLHIVDYRLQTLRYPLKQTKIPSFVGRMVMEAHLPAPLMDVFKTLYCFAPYAGIGVKTALGMGGIQIQPALE